MTAKHRVPHVPVGEIPTWGTPGVTDVEDPSQPQQGAIIQQFGSRRTFVADGTGHWIEQNDDHGAKLDAILVAAEAQLHEQRRANEFLELLVNVLTS